ncbi:hypothetical protein [Dyella telluris]|uniref:Uncharacterized protein n=1 Tax=Dyella telluris TaxID=2763498 RepID=A0A7G8PZY3_9GAMM|nr:hypothetical protein [Dyella telluris]QNK00091.1 hypothetical protein H8F01_13245 [Dyella telluris]
MFKDDTMPRPDPQWMVDAFHPWRIALKGDALEPWNMIAIAVLTVIAGLVFESRVHKGWKKPYPGFRAGVLMGLLVSVVTLGPLAWVSYRALSTGAMHCMMKRCPVGDFTDVAGHRYIDNGGHVSMTFDPLFFWTSYLSLTLFTVTALMFLFSCLRACRHWRELD